MKKFLVLAALVGLCSANAFAMGGKGLIDSSWSELRSARQIQINQPLFATPFGPAGVFNVCATDTQFVSIADVRTCVEPVTTYVPPQGDQGGYNETVCAKWANIPVARDRKHDEEVCDVYNANYGREGDSGDLCLKSHTNHDAFYGTEVKMEVLADNGGDAGLQSLGSKTYQIQPCAK